MEEFLTFRRMVTPVVIQALFWIGVVLTTVIGIVEVVAGITGTDGGLLVLSGMFVLLIGPLIVRISCELLMVVFRISDTLTDIKDNMSSEGD